MVKMGNKKRKVRERIQEVTKQVEEGIHDKGIKEQIKRLKNDELFSIDTLGEKSKFLSTTVYSKCKPIIKDPSIWSKKRDGAKKLKSEEAIIKKLKLKALNKQKHEKQKSLKKEKVSKKKELDGFIEPIVRRKESVRPKMPSVKIHINTIEIPSTGQSYLPEFNAHQDVIAEAVAKEKEKEEQEKIEKLPISRGLSNFTKQFITDETSDDDSDNNMSENNSDEDNRKNLRKRIKSKLTKAQRNKKSRHKIKSSKEKYESKKKKFLKQINNVQHIAKSIENHEIETLKKKAFIKEQNKLVPYNQPKVRIGGKLVRMIKTPDVNLSHELTENLRQIKPVGNILKDRLDSFHLRNMIIVGAEKKKKKQHLKKYRRIERD